MRFIIKTHEHTDTEIQMHHKYGFSLVRGFGRVGSLDCMSASANSKGFTTLHAIANICKWNDEQLKFYEDIVNEHHIVRYLDDFQPNLILVPKTRGSNRSKNSPEYFITEIIKQCNHRNIKRLHFTHYSFIESKFPAKEITSILNILLNPLTYQTLDEFYFEIDSRHLRELEDLYDLITNHVYRLRKIKPSVIDSQKFKMVNTGRKFGELDEAIFVKDDEYVGEQIENYLKNF